MQFDKREGGISSLVFGGVEFITRAPKISFAAPTVTLEFTISSFSRKE